MSLKVVKKQKEQVQQVTGSDILIDALTEQNVEFVFGYPGGAVLPIYDALYRKKASFQHILTRHEQGADSCS